MNPDGSEKHDVLQLDSEWELLPPSTDQITREVGHSGYAGATG